MILIFKSALTDSYIFVETNKDQALWVSSSAKMKYFLWPDLLRNTMGNIGWELARKQNSRARTTGSWDSLISRRPIWFCTHTLSSQLWRWEHNKSELEQWSLLTVKKSGGEKRWLGKLWEMLVPHAAISSHHGRSVILSAPTLPDWTTRGPRFSTCCYASSPMPWRHSSRQPKSLWAFLAYHCVFMA